MTKIQELASLQAVRACAALAVVFHHSFRAVTIHRPAAIVVPATAYWPDQRWVNIGAAGVDIFFVLSGFLMVYISGPYMRGKRSPGDFLLRRFVRIWPLYAIFTVVGIAEAILRAYRTGLPQFDLQPLRLLSLVFIPSINQDGLVAPIVGIGWTLTYEAFYYVCFALILWRVRRRPALALALVLALSYAAGAISSETALGRFFHNDIIFEFLLGAGVARFFLVRSVWPSHGPLWIGAGLILLGASAFNVVPTLPRLVSGGMPALLILIGALAVEPVVRFPRWLVRLGDASYALYLVHILITSHAPNVLLRILVRGAAAHFSIIAAGMATVLFCVIAGFWVHLIIEKPLLRLCARGVNAMTGRAIPQPLVTEAE